MSVIIPAFNAAGTVQQAIKTAIHQTYCNLEIIVVDDGSTDGTSSLAEACAVQDARVLLLRKSNAGVSSAFNKGIAAARGEYIARLDADDLWHPTKIEKQIKTATREPAAAFIYTFVRYVDSAGYVVRDISPQFFPSQALCRGIYENLVGANSSAMVRRSVVMDLGGYDEALTSWEDLVLQLRISAQHPISFVPEYLVGYRIRPESLSADPRNMFNSWLNARRRLLDLFPHVPPYVHNWGHARKCGELAEGFASRRQYPLAVQLLALAFIHDREWAFSHFTYRLRRRFSCRGEAQANLRHFLQYSPTEEAFRDDFTTQPEAWLLRRYHQRRVRALTKLDLQLADSIRALGSEVVQ